MTLLRELIEIPERVGRGDYVFALQDAVKEPERVLADYVVTDQLAESFNEALAFVGGALRGGESKATYLHGSFGSGKSHFMAVLYLLLAHDAAARSVAELQPAVARHDEWIQGKRFLLVPIHMINSGARTLEQAVLGGYVQRVRELHPDAPTPPVYVADGIIENAADLRRRMGDAAFFGALNEGSAEEVSGLGELAAPEWDGERFEAAIAAGPGDTDHDWLVSTLVDTVLSAYRDVARSDSGGFVTLSEGLGAVSRHAQELGYDGIVLFLDELILWLATQIQDTTFVQEEGRKIAALREAPRAERPVPIASFVARQRDLRQLVGEHVPGAEHLAFEDTLTWWEGRFDTIVLEDRNLHQIAERRVLRPKAAGAKAQIDAEFAKLRSREDVLRVLLGEGASVEEFRSVYPFSPAFIAVLVAASSVLQRERTAIRVMVQLLSERRDELEVGDVVPAGDLFDVLASGDQPFSVEMKRDFDHAKRLYARTLRPQLLAAHGLEPDAAERSELPAGFGADDRLVKTLLLAALIRDAEPFRGLTVSRLVALNHGTIASPVPGQERSMALTRLRALGGAVGELRIGEDPHDPSVELQLSGVDTESILQRARGEQDNAGTRRRLLRSTVLAAIGVDDQEALFSERVFRWRGTERHVDVLFANVRELAGDRAMAADDRWRVVIDFPFDAEGTGVRDDEARIEELRSELGPVRTVFWLPALFTREVLEDLGRLATIEGVLSGQRLEQYASHLSQGDRELARSILDNRRSQLRERIRQALDQAYGIATARAEVVEDPDFDRFHALDEGIDLRPPVAPNLGGAFDGLLDQLLRHQFSAHPEFGETVKPAALRSVWEEVRRATEAEGGRITVERPRRARMAAIAGPLKLGEMHEGPFVLGRHWPDRFSRLAARDGVERPTVAQLRAWMDDGEPMGLPRLASSLVILTYAAQENLRFRRHGGAYPVSDLVELPDDLELVAQELPSEEAWALASQRAGALLGVAVPPLRTAANLERYGRAVVDAAAARLEAARRLRGQLEGNLVGSLGIEADADRLNAARELEALLASLAGVGEVEALPALAAASYEATDEELGRSASRAGAVSDAIAAANWSMLGTVVGLAGGGDAEAVPIVESLRTAARTHELAAPLVDALSTAEAGATALLASRAGRAEDQRPGGTDEGDERRGGLDPVVVSQERGLDLFHARARLADTALEAEDVVVDITIRRRGT
ncbi:MAG: DUF6079 family protein [Actinomycetota bacterium]|nr:DUF6079 family protein [Actinomycetota bacterium]